MLTLAGQASARAATYAALRASGVGWGAIFFVVVYVEVQLAGFLRQQPAAQQSVWLTNMAKTIATTQRRPGRKSAIISSKKSSILSQPRSMMVVMSVASVSADAYLRNVAVRV